MTYEDKCTPPCLGLSANERENFVSAINYYIGRTRKRYRSLLNKFGYPTHDAAAGGPLVEKGQRTDGLRTHPLIEVLGRI